MPRRRRLSGPDVVTILGTFGFEVVSVRGSHAKLRRTADGQRQTLHVPLHSELDTGTAQAIFRQAAGYISAADLRPHFYSD